MAEGKPPPWYHSALFWGCVSAVLAIVPTVIATMKNDVRWLLVVAWPFASVAMWEFARARGSSSPSKWGAAGAAASGVGFVVLYWWLSPDPIGWAVPLSQLTIALSSNKIQIALIALGLAVVGIGVGSWQPPGGNVLPETVAPPLMQPPAPSRNATPYFRVGPKVAAIDASLAALSNYINGIIERGRWVVQNTNAYYAYNGPSEYPKRAGEFERLMNGDIAKYQSAIGSIQRDFEDINGIAHIDAKLFDDFREKTRLLMDAVQEIENLRARGDHDKPVETGRTFNLVELQIIGFSESLNRLTAWRDDTITKLTELRKHITSEYPGHPALASSFAEGAKPTRELHSIDRGILTEMLLQIKDALTDTEATMNKLWNEQVSRLPNVSPAASLPLVDAISSGIDGIQKKYHDIIQQSRYALYSGELNRLGLGETREFEQFKSELGAYRQVMLSLSKLDPGQKELDENHQVQNTLFQSVQRRWQECWDWVTKRNSAWEMEKKAIENNL